MEEAAFCTMLVLNVGPYRKQLRFREVPLGQGAALPMSLANHDILCSIRLPSDAPPKWKVSDKVISSTAWLFPTGMGVRASNG